MEWLEWWARQCLEEMGREAEVAKIVSTAPAMTIIAAMQAAWRAPRPDIYAISQTNAADMQRQYARCFPLHAAIDDLNALGSR